MPSTIQVEIKRQATPQQPVRTEKFEIPYRPNMNITSLLGEIALNPVTTDGRRRRRLRTTRTAWRRSAAAARC
jgi:succinate dehydrogenase / fumarate reductase iron-sulfur subunit